LSSLKYYYVDEPNDKRVSPISDELKIALELVLNSITSITELPPLKVKLSSIRYSYSLWRYWMTKEEGTDFATALGNNQVINLK
jgi:fatty acid amide hydrolase 2